MSQSNLFSSPDDGYGTGDYGMISQGSSEKEFKNKIVYTVIKKY